MRPTFELSIEGQTPADALRQRLISLRVTEKAGQESGSLEIKLSNDPPLEPPRTGVEARVRLGYEHTELHEAGIYIIEGVDLDGPPPTMKIHGAATNFAKSDTGTGILQAIRSQKTRSWHDTTVGAIVETVAGEQGLEPVVASSLASTPIEHLDQVDQSDMALLTQIGRRFDAVAKTMAGRLVFLPEGEGKKSNGASLPLVELPIQELTSWRIRKTGKQEYGSVTAHYHDGEKADRQDVTVGSGEPTKTLRDDFPNEAEAQAAAEAELKKQRRQSQEMTIKLPGRPDIFVEQPIKIPDGPPGTGGDWVVASIDHSLGTGLQTSITARPKAG